MISSLLSARALALETLQAALAEALAGGGRAVLLAGEAGIGKTRLPREFSNGAVAASVPRAGQPLI